MEEASRVSPFDRCSSIIISFLSQVLLVKGLQERAPDPLISAGAGFPGGTFSFRLGRTGSGGGGSWGAGGWSVVQGEARGRQGM